MTNINNQTGDVLHNWDYNSIVALPQEFADKLLLHPYPILFWIGQILNFTMRYNDRLQNHIEQKIKLFKF